MKEGLYLKFKEPYEVEIYKGLDDSYFYIDDDKVSVYVMGATVEETIEEFTLDFAFQYENLVLDNINRLHSSA